MSALGQKRHSASKYWPSALSFHSKGSLSPRGLGRVERGCGPVLPMKIRNAWHYNLSFEPGRGEWEKTVCASI